MAQLAFTVAGGAIGSVVPGVGTVLGAQVGALVGGVVGPMITPGPTTYGPRLDDPSVAAGDYGAPLTINYGTSPKIQCERFWVKGNKRDARTKKQSTGGKGGGPSFVTTEYFATFAAQITDAPITALRRLWLGRELVFDGTVEAITEALASGARIPLTGVAAGVTFRLYKGAADQMPDPAMQAEDPFASAYRGYSWILVEDLPLEQWANEIPPPFAEISTEPPERPHYGLTLYGSTILEPGATFDAARGRLLVAKANSQPILVYDIISGVLARTDNFSARVPLWRDDAYGPLNEQPATLAQATLNNIGPAIAPDGSFYIFSEEWPTGISFGAGNLVDAESGQFLASLSTDANVVFAAAFGLAHGPSDATPSIVTDHKIRQIDWLPIDPTTGVQPFLYLRCVRNGWCYGGQVALTDRGRTYARLLIGTNLVMSSSEFHCDIDRAGLTVFLAYRRGGLGLEVAKVPIAGFLDVSPYEAGAYFPTQTAAVSGAIGALTDALYDSDADTFVVIGVSGFQVFDSDLASVAVVTGAFRSAGHRSRSTLDGKIWFASASTASGAEKDTLRAYSTATGELVQTEPLGAWSLTDTNAFDPVWQFRQDVWVAHTGGSTGGDWTYRTKPAVLLGDRSAVGKVPLADVVIDVARRAGLAAGQVDVSAVTRLIYGAAFKAVNVTGRGILEDLLTHTQHEIAMIDGVLKVFPRPVSSSGTLTDADLGADGGAPLKRRTDSTAVPRRLELNYHSIEAQLERGQQAAEFPVEVVPAGEQIRIETAMVMDDAEAAVDVQTLMGEASAERTEFEAAVPYTRGDIEPGQIWGVSDLDGVQAVRVQEIAGGRVLALRGRSAWPFLNPDGAFFDNAKPIPVLGERPATDFDLIDSHMWRDVDDGPAFYYLGWPRRIGLTWPGGVLYRSTDPFVFDTEFAAITAAATAGVSIGELGDVPTAHLWDRGNALTVRMKSGTPESASEADVLVAANPVWVQCGETGEWELIQFATATENADGTWTLTNLLRGRRGTEHLTGSHAPGDRVLWADQAFAKRSGGSLIGTQVYFVSATLGASQDLSTRRGFVNNARALRPYSVGHIAGSRGGGGDLTITWVRRSRIAGGPALTTVPLGEETEAYEIDVIDDTVSPEVVVRTIAASGPSAVYTGSQQSNDFGGPKATVKIRIYQLSGTFGRGVVKEAIV